jgi:galactonate dehydratase
MRITAVEPLVLGTSWRNLVFLKVKTDEGLVGIGECTLQNREEGVLGYLQGAARRHVIGSDPFNIEDLWLRMYRNDFWRAGVMATTVMSGIEIACWDIIGKALGQPVWRLLGGRCHEKIKAYANAWYTVERKPEEFARRVKVVLDQGYQALKVDPFGPGALELAREEKVRSVELVAAIREAVGPNVEIFIEMHGRFSAATAMELARMLEPYQPGWIEEPCPPEDIPSLKKVAEHVNIPVAPGERCFTRYGFRDLILQGAVPILNADAKVLGGVTEFMKVVALAQAYDLDIAPHGSQDIHVHLVAAIANGLILEYYPKQFDPMWDRMYHYTLQLNEDGTVSPPNVPGIGVDPNYEALDSYRVD